MKLHWSPKSPYVRKVMICAHELDLVPRLTLVRSVAAMLKPNPDIMRDNPLSKIPTLVLDDGTDAVRLDRHLRVPERSRRRPAVSAGRRAQVAGAALARVCRRAARHPDPLAQRARERGAAPATPGRVRAQDHGVARAAREGSDVACGGPDVDRSRHHRLHARIRRLPIRRPWLAYQGTAAWPSGIGSSPLVLRTWQRNRPSPSSPQL